MFMNCSESGAARGPVVTQAQEGHGSGLSSLAPSLLLLTKELL